MTLRQLATEPPTIPTRTSWHLADLAESKGRFALHTRQSPQRLKALREHALIESAVSSNRIEGVEVDQSRIGTLMFGKPALRDRDEEEVQGYRDALRWIHEQGAKLSISVSTLKKVDKLCRGEIWDSGVYKEKDVDIIQKYADGRSRVRFKSVPAKQTPKAMTDMVELWQRGLREKWIHPLVLAAALNLDFLCVHPFRDGNGRVSRLLFLLACYHCGLEVGRYISLERLVEQSKEDYYECLNRSSQRWHEGKHDFTPWTNFFFAIIRRGYAEFEQRAGQVKAPRGTKTDLVEAAIEAQSGPFRVSDIQHACPGVSLDMIRQVLKNLRGRKVECLGRGQNAQWRVIGK